MKNLEPINATSSEAVSNIASKMTYTGSGAGVIGGLGGIDWMTWIGVAVAVAGLLINLIFKIREDRRKDELHKIQVAKLKEGAHAK